jgi:hypothetical protein
MLDPAWTRRELITEPAPVWNPQPSGPRSSSGGAADGMTTRLRAGTTACVAKEDWPNHRAAVSSPARPRAAPEPSGRRPVKLREKNAAQLAGRPVRQARHAPQESNDMTTRSPTATSVTYSPTA